MSNAAVKLATLGRFSIFETDAILKKALEKFSTVQKEAEAVGDVTDANITEATTVLTRLKKSEKWFTEQRQDKTRPLKEEAKVIEGDFASMVLDPLKNLRAAIDAKILAYHERKEREAMEAREKVLAAQRALEEKEARVRENAQRQPLAKTSDEAVLPPLPFERPVEAVLPALELAIPEAPRTFRTEQGSVSIAKEWKAEVSDLTKLLLAIAGGLAPQECIAVNDAYLNRLAIERKGLNPPPGVTFVQKAHTVTR